MAIKVNKTVKEFEHIFSGQEESEAKTKVKCRTLNKREIASVQDGSTEWNPSQGTALIKTNTTAYKVCAYAVIEGYDFEDGEGNLTKLSADEVIEALPQSFISELAKEIMAKSQGGESKDFLE